MLLKRGAESLELRIVTVNVVEEDNRGDPKSVAVIVKRTSGVIS